MLGATDAAFGTMCGVGHSVLQVPVVELDDVVRAGAEAASDDVVLAHVTVLGPFLDELAIDSDVVERLARFFGSVPTFEFALTRVEAFAGGPTYLVPEPAAAFRELTARLWDMFPSCPPYGGMFDDVIPHLSLGDMSAGDARRLLATRLPVVATARVVDLVWYGDSVKLLRRFELGGGGA